MIGSVVREFASARTMPWVAAAFSETIIQVWDVQARQQLDEYQATFLLGARNLAMHPDGCQIVSGRSSKTGGLVSSYETLGGGLLWDRRRLNYPSCLRFSICGSYVYCSINRSRVEKLDARTGKTIRLLAKTSKYFDGCEGYSLKVPLHGSEYLLNKELSNNERRIKKLTFGVLDVVFSPDFLFLSEIEGPVRCIDCASGIERWLFRPPPGSHVLNLYWSNREQCLFGVLRHYDTSTERYLMKFNQETGLADQICELRNSWEETFICVTEQLLTASGEIIDLLSGLVVARLPFPQLTAS